MARHLQTQLYSFELDHTYFYTLHELHNPSRAKLHPLPFQITSSKDCLMKTLSQLQDLLVTLKNTQMIGHLTKGQLRLHILKLNHQELTIPHRPQALYQFHCTLGRHQRVN